jgi:hypothetical protein
VVLASSSYQYENLHTTKIKTWSISTIRTEKSTSIPKRRSKNTPKKFSKILRYDTKGGDYMDKKKIGALVAALIAALTAFWMTYSSEMEEEAPVAPAPVVEPVAAPAPEAPAPVAPEAPAAPEVVAPVEVK